MRKKSKFTEFELAPQVAIDQYEDIADDFLKRIFGFEGCLVTDESRLTDFIDKSGVGGWFNDIEEAREYELTERDIQIVETRKQEALEKIKDVYGIDVSDIEDLILVKIFEAIKRFGKI